MIRWITVFSVLLSLTCYFERSMPVAPEDCGSSVMIELLNADSVDIVKICIAGPSIDTQYYYQKLNSNTFVVLIEPGFDREILVEGYNDRGVRCVAWRDTLIEVTSTSIHLVALMQPALPSAPPGAPQNTNGLVLSNLSVALSWDTVEGARMYDVMRNQQPENIKILITQTTEMECLDTQTQPGAHYLYTVIAKNDDGESPASNAISVTIPLYQSLPPPVPVPVAAVVQSCTSMVVAWGRSPEALTYSVYRGQTGQAVDQLIGTTSDTVLIDLSCQPLTPYAYAVVALNDYGESQLSSIVTAETQICAPEVPQQVKVIPQSSTELVLTWLPVASAQGYIVYSSLSASGNFMAIDTVVNTPFVHGNLVPMSIWYYQVSSFNSSGESPRSSTISASTVLAIPSTPTGLRSTGQTSFAISMAWLPVSNASSYKVYRKSPGESALSVCTTVSDTLFNDTGLLSNNEYQYAVSALNGAGESPYSLPVTVTVTTLLVIPSTPSSLVATAQSSTEIRIQFNAANGATGYRIYWSTQSNGTFALLATTGSTSYSHTKLGSGTTYYYKVAAYNAAGESAQSAQVSATTSLNLPATPGNLSAVSKSSTSIQIDCGAVTGASGYRIYHSATSGGTFSLLVDITGTSHLQTGLSAGSTHYYKVSSYNTAGESSLSNAVSATTAISVPSTPANPRATASSATSISISYSASTGATSYKIYSSLNSSGTFALVTSVAATTYIHTSLKSGTTYYYKVSAANVSGESPLSAFFSAIAKKFIAVVNTTKCTCSSHPCISACPTGAITHNGKAVINLSKCDGCGNCVVACKKAAITLKEQ